MHEIVDTEQWLQRRLALLDEEKALQQARDSLAAKRRALPWRRLDTQYVFETESGERSLADLFDGHTQLIVYHFMFHPDWDEGCKSCSFWADTYDHSVPHLAARDVAFTAVSRAPLGKLLAYRKRLGWTFPWVSSQHNRFNYDFQVSFTPAEIEAGGGTYNYIKGFGRIEELPGISVFARDGDEVYHSYSTYSRGLDPYNGTYQLLDIVPKGRDEDELPYTMDWVRRRDQY